MKTLPALFLSLAMSFLSAGCGSMDLTPPSFGDRALEGAVVFQIAGPVMPADTEVKTTHVGDIEQAGVLARGEVLGEQTIIEPSKPPIPFRIEYRAEDAVLRRGLNIDVRVSIAGKLAYYTASAHPLTSANVNEMHLVEVVPVAHDGRQ